MPLFDNTEIEEQLPENNLEENIEEITQEVIQEANIPSIDLIIEDGSGIPNANSYCDLDYAIEYCTMKGYSDWLNLSEDEQKIYLIRGTEFVDNYFTWKGVRKFLTQSMSFPRENIYDIDHFKVTGIPDKLKKACIEAAWLNATSGADTLFSSKDTNGKIKKQKVDSLEVEYFNSEETSDSKTVDYTTIYDILNKLLKGLYKTGSQNSRVCARAVYNGW